MMGRRHLGKTGMPIFNLVNYCTPGYFEYFGISFHMVVAVNIT